MKGGNIQTKDPRQIAAAMDKPFSIKPVIVDEEGLTRRGQKRVCAIQIHKFFSYTILIAIETCSRTTHQETADTETDYKAKTTRTT